MAATEDLVAAQSAVAAPAAEALEALQARHRKELRDLQSRITSKKKNASKKTRKGVNDECAELERQIKERHKNEVAKLTGDGAEDDEEDEDEEDENDKGNVDGISKGLADAKLDGPSSSVSPSSSAATTAAKQQEQQQADEPTAGGGGGKKRNRQKERLARRAAEREAEAVAAETEAASMTDHRKIERGHLDREFKANGLTEHEIAPDGHCLFSAVADQLKTTTSLSGSDETVKKSKTFRDVRKDATSWMEEHPDDFAPFLEEELGGYVRKMRDTAEWGGQLELAALANCYGCVIKVVQEGRTETIEPSSSSSSSTGSRDEEEVRETIWLAYYRHGYGLGEHYNSLRKTG